MTETAERGAISREVTGTYETWDIPARQEVLMDLIEAAFEDWQDIMVGPLIPGAAWEVRPPTAPRISVLDGYATVDFGDWHFHVCVGPFAGGGEEAARIYPTARAEFYRMLRDDQPTSWGVRLFNGQGDQQMTIILPSPFFVDGKMADPPRYDRLALWDRLRQRVLGLSSDPHDRSFPGYAAQRRAAAHV